MFFQSFIFIISSENQLPKTTQQLLRTYPLFSLAGCKGNQLFFPSKSFSKLYFHHQLTKISSQKPSSSTTQELHRFSLLRGAKVIIFLNLPNLFSKILFVHSIPTPVISTLQRTYRLSTLLSSPQAGRKSNDLTQFCKYFSQLFSKNVKKHRLAYFTIIIKDAGNRVCYIIYKTAILFPAVIASF